jgi:hypothetical protein
MTNEEAKQYVEFCKKFESDLGVLFKKRPRSGKKERRIEVKIPPTFTKEQRIDFWEIWKNQAVMLPADTWLQKNVYSYLTLEEARECIPYNKMAVDLETSNTWLFIFRPLNHYK